MIKCGGRSAPKPRGQQGHRAGFGSECSGQGTRSPMSCVTTPPCGATQPQAPEHLLMPTLPHSKGHIFTIKSIFVHHQRRQIPFHVIACASRCLWTLTNWFVQSDFPPPCWNLSFPNALLYTANWMWVCGYFLPTFMNPLEWSVDGISKQILF